MPIVGSFSKTNANVSVTPVNINTITKSRIHRILITNSNASPKVIRFYDSSSSPTVGTTSCKPFVVPASGQAFFFDTENPLFASVNKLWVACTDGFQDSDASFSGNNVRVDIDYLT